MRCCRGDSMSCGSGSGSRVYRRRACGFLSHLPKRRTSPGRALRRLRAPVPAPLSRTHVRADSSHKNFFFGRRRSAGDRALLSGGCVWLFTHRREKSRGNRADCRHEYELERRRADELPHRCRADELCPRSPEYSQARWDRRPLCSSKVYPADFALAGGLGRYSFVSPPTIIGT